MRIDSHQHFWRYDPAEYGWMQPTWSIRRDFLPSDLRPELTVCQLNGCVAVQARQTTEETRWLLELAEESPWIIGVVGWVDLRADNIEEQLAHWTKHPKLVGVRHVVQDEPDDKFLLGSSFQRGIAALKAHRLTYDLLVFPRQLPAAIELVRRFPEQPFVLDHIAKPLIRDGVLKPWDEQITELARSPNVLCKISGMVTEAAWEGWKPADFKPYLERVVTAFGVDRLMYGSDWPVALLAGSYRRVYDLAHDFVATLGAAAERAVFGQNAARFYLERRV